jgi:hypothetical protein
MQNTTDKTPEKDDLSARNFGSPIRSKMIDKMEEATPYFNNPDENQSIRKYSIEVSAFKVDNEMTLGQETTPKH